MFFEKKSLDSGSSKIVNNQSDTHEKVRTWVGAGFMGFGAIMDIVGTALILTNSEIETENNWTKADTGAMLFWAGTFSLLAGTFMFCCGCIRRKLYAAFDENNEQVKLTSKPSMSYGATQL